MKTEHRRPDDLFQACALPIRSEAFAEDLEGLLPRPDAASEPRRALGHPARSTRATWLLLPLAVVLIGSASALAWF
jgi:hypothetical protein